MATEYINIEGQLQYAKVYEPDNAFGASNWQTNIFPKDDKEWEKIKSAGIQKKIKENNDPAKGPIGKYIEFTRPVHRIINKEMVYFTGPIVEQGDGTVIVDYVNSETDQRVRSYQEHEKNKIQRRGKPILLGNGTDAVIRVAVYDTQKGKGQRLDSIKVLNLVEYTPKTLELPPVLEDVRTALEPVDMTENNSSNDLDDEIPF